MNKKRAKRKHDVSCVGDWWAIGCKCQFLEVVDLEEELDFKEDVEAIVDSACLKEILLV